MSLRRLFCLPLAALLVAVLASCGSSGSSASGPGQRGGDLSGPWSLTAAAVDSVPLSDFGITVEFAEPMVSGSSGVNRYTGSYEADPSGALAFGEIASTMMAGPEDAMNAERLYLASLARVDGFAVDGDTLTLLSGQQDLLVFDRQ